MNTEVTQALEELKRQFPASTLQITDDGQGGAYAIVEPVFIGERYVPSSTWIGAHVPAQYPYADLYPVFMGGDVARADGIAFVAPITSSSFQGRPALAISRRNNTAQQRPQTAVAKFLKILDFLEKLQ